MSDLIPDHIGAITPYKPGKPLEELEREYGIKNSIKIASNENPLGIAPKALQAIRDAAETVNLYPDGHAFRLRSKLSKKHGVPIEQIICGSGSVEIIEMLPRSFLNADENVVTSAMTFPSYKIATYMVNTNFRESPTTEDMAYNLDALLDLVDRKTKLIFIANPNNPTGTMIKKPEFDRFLEKLPSHPILVLDEAYFEYMDDPEYPDGLEYLTKRDRFVVLRTFSKIYGLAGLRVGHAFSSKEIIEALNKIRSPFNVNSIAQAAAVAALDDEDHVLKSRENNQNGLKYLSAEFERMELKYIPSHANFILVIPERPVEELDEALKREGIIARAAGNSAMRISIGKKEENERFVRTIEKLL